MMKARLHHLPLFRFFAMIIVAFLGLLETGLVVEGLSAPMKHHPPQKQLTPRGDSSQTLLCRLGIHLDRRSVLLAAAALLVLAPPRAAVAGIDVSGLAVEAYNPLDVFLGGTYYDDDDDDDDSSSDRGGTTLDGRISRKKYTIVEDTGSTTLLGTPRKKKTSTDIFEGLKARPVKILGESSSISSSRDDPFELTGTIYLCPDGKKSQQGCITIDFSPLGGSAKTKGYWDASESGIRFVDSQKVWSKQ